MPAEPQDHKAAIEPFVWKAADGSDVTFKPFTKLPIKTFRDLREAGEVDAMFILIDAATDPESRAVLDEQPLDVLNGIIEDWQRASGVVLPES